jgi:hypothetical protein
MQKIIFLFLLFVFVGKSQSKITPKPIGKFLLDSTSLGEITSYSIVYKHDAKQEVFFTDKTFNYEPFKLVDKVYFPTETKNGISKDSAVYLLRTFSIEPIQYISLPIFLKKGIDSSIVYSAKDSITLKTQIGGNFEKLQLKDKAELVQMKSKVDIFKLFLQLGLISFFTFLWWLVFGNTIKSQINVFSAYRSHNEFEKQFNKYTNTINKANLVKALDHWKKYMGKLYQKSFKTMTTPEIINEIPNENLEEALREIDKSIYGTVISDKIQDAFGTLKDLSNEKYKLKKKSFSLIKKPVKNIFSKS